MCIRRLAAKLKEEQRRNPHRAATLAASHSEYDKVAKTRTRLAVRADMYIEATHFRGGVHLKQAGQGSGHAESSLVVAETLASYVPLATVRHCFTMQAGEVWAPRVESFDGAVVFCDIAGFTPLTEKYAREGPDGAEKLVSFLNQYFGRLIRMVHEHGGDVILFAGDALIAMWGSKHNSEHKMALPDEILRECAFAAVKCAATIDEAVNSDPNSDEPRLHMGVGAGQLHFLQVGGVADSWTYLLCGEPLAQIALGGSLSSHGTVVSPQVWSLVDAMFDGGPVHIKAAAASLADQADGFVQILGAKPAFEDAPVMTQAVVKTAFEARVTGSLRMFIPKVIQKNTKPGELTQNVKLTNAASLERAHQVVRTIQTAFYRYGGVINKILLDDKGFIILAGFGLPPFAHEDDPERAVLAALESQEQLALIQVVSAIGITTGTAFCGIVGSKERREYTVIGDAFERIGRKKFKGKANEIEVWAPAAIAERKALKSLVDMERRNVPLVGRNREMLLVARALRARTGAVNHNTGLRVVCVEGEAGEGKTRLLEEAQRYAVALGYSVVQGCGSEISKSIQYSSFAGVLSDVLAGARSSDSLLPINNDAESDALHAAGPPAARRGPAQQANLVYKIYEDTGLSASLDNIDPIYLLAGVLPGLKLHARIPVDGPGAPSLGGRAKLDATGKLCMAILEWQSRSAPTLLLMDDINHLDSSSRNLLVAAVNAELPGLMVMTGARPFGHVPRFYAELRGDARSQRSMTVSLDSLPPCAIRQIAAARLKVKELPSVVEETVVSKTGGNPFFAEQMVHAMKDRKLVHIESGYCVVPSGVSSQDIRSMPVPGPLQAYIVSRMDRLAPSVAKVSKVAACIGMTFSASILMQVHPSRTGPSAAPSASGTPALWPTVEAELQALIAVGFIELAAAQPHEALDGSGTLSNSGSLPSASSGGTNLSGSSSDMFAHLQAVRSDSAALTPSSVFRFCNKVIHDVVYDLLPYRERALLHAEIALCLEALSGALATDMEALFRHYCSSNMPAKAIKYAEILATRAMKNFDYDAAYAIRDKLLSLDLTRVPLVHVLATRRKLAETAILLGNEVGAVRLLLEALFMAREALPAFSPPEVEALLADENDPAANAAPRDVIYPVLLWHCLDAEREARAAPEANKAEKAADAPVAAAASAIRRTRRASLSQRISDIASRAASPRKQSPLASSTRTPHAVAELDAAAIAAAAVAAGPLPAAHPSPLPPPPADELPPPPPDLVAALAASAMPKPPPPIPGSPASDAPRSAIPPNFVPSERRNSTPPSIFGAPSRITGPPPPLPDDDFDIDILPMPPAGLHSSSAGSSPAASPGRPPPIPRKISLPPPNKPPRRRDSLPPKPSPAVFAPPPPLP
ncbi:AAA ATPase [Thecamonas trahens ATCC 50062]|uniref:AAA ATPase n=1 Tax=Thecamonas trahens ATCC 50062 TaxID=461836 RepID=A0A0L0DM37_THETB|nr:AAA ATPase [Thecamonas trahens ATCC 50062]KNC53377.1 AAA ATPase [Thecamonas trahens ATCC 50062]|eukprot:XP_013754422.1 AAA ATPase [Thecamonas trahens ATCC 50062]